MTDTIDRFEYDVALLYVGGDQEIVGRLADAFDARQISVLLDDYEATQQPGTYLLTHIAEILRTKAWYCLLLVSERYPLARWTEAERTAVQQHALRDADQYILLLRLDDHEIPGSAPAGGITDLRQSSVESIVDLVDGKLRETRRPSGPPPQSHDLRSGNVPPAEGT